MFYGENVYYLSRFQMSIIFVVSGISFWKNEVNVAYLKSNLASVKFAMGKMP